MNTVFMNGLEMKLHGELPAVGTPAPELDLIGQDLQPIKLADFKGQRVVLNIFPSLDTDVCATSVRKFNTQAASLPNTKVLCVSMDLPFAAARFCSVNGIENVKTGSGFRSQFGDRYGVRIENGPLQDLYARALVVIDENGIVKATSLCEQITSEPDYEMVKKELA
ncbi:MAG: thiol peroxidase [Muribaculaceae bacterium]|nr:thiol peroxidase [Muribaculaceae bacterium]MDE7190654.1 thiol peroxidase [Muribaculaceae bacterium]